MTPVSQQRKWGRDTVVTGADHIIATSAAAFVDARREARPLATYPGPVPATLAEAYAIQREAIRLTGTRIGGWKVGRINPPLDVAFGSNRLAGPIFASRIVAATDRNAMPVFDGGFGAVEAEFVFRLGTVDPAKTTYSLDEAAACVDAVFAGIEIASSPLAAINDLGAAVTVSDFGNNHGLIVGPQIDDWHDVDDWMVTVEIDGHRAGGGTAKAFPDGTIGAVRFLLENLAARGISVPAGTLVSSGAISGVHRVAVGQSARAQFADTIELSCTIIRAEAER